MTHEALRSHRTRPRLLYLAIIILLSYASFYLWKVHNPPGQEMALGAYPAVITCSCAGRCGIEECSYYFEYDRVKI